MTKRSHRLVLLGAGMLPVLAFTFGGWCVITVDDLPDHAVAGTPVNVSFAVRQHGVSLMRDLSPEIVATSKGVAAKGTVTGGTNGRYNASLTLPRAGDWTVTINSGFMNNSITLVPIKATDAGAPAPAPLSDIERGMRLFVAKGCVTCHSLEETSAWKSASVGPALTGRRYVAEVLASFLADPERSPLARNTTTSDIRMPNLGLEQREIASLVAFINANGTAVSRSLRK
jgi:mono/diheme cytochrome c family protein